MAAIAEDVDVIGALDLLGRCLRRALRVRACHAGQPADNDQNDVQSFHDASPPWSILSDQKLSENGAWLNRYFSTPEGNNPSSLCFPALRRIELRRLGAIVHAVIPGHLDDPDIVGGGLIEQKGCKCDAGWLVRQLNQRHELAVTIDVGKGFAGPVACDRKR